MIDLHTHSTCSDGSESPERVVELAAEAGCSAIALTDHDGLEGIEAARRHAGALGLELVGGCEVSCLFEPGTMHILCYFVDKDRGPLPEELDRLRRDREVRNEALLERLVELGLPVERAEVESRAGSAFIGRPHIAQVLVDKGVVATVGEAFDRYLGKGAPAYVSKARVLPAEVIGWASASGAVASVAHPLSLGLDPEALDATLALLVEAGLTGLECSYATYDPPTRARLTELARRRGLVPTGGSDFHGSYKPDVRIAVGLGDLAVDDGVLEALRARRPGA